MVTIDGDALSSHHVSSAALSSAPHISISPAASHSRWGPGVHSVSLLSPHWPTRLCCHKCIWFCLKHCKGSYDNHQCMWLKICSPAWFVWPEEFPWRERPFFPHQKVSLLAKISKVNFLSREGQRNHSRILTCLSTQGMGLEADEEVEHSSCCWGRSWRWGKHFSPSTPLHALTFTHS